MNGKANVTPAMMTLGWYPKELYKQDYGKMAISYIDRLNDISEEELINHLMDLKKGFCWSRCVRQIFKGSRKNVFLYIGVKS